MLPFMSGEQGNKKSKLLNPVVDKAKKKRIAERSSGKSVSKAQLQPKNTLDRWFSRSTSNCVVLDNSSSDNEKINGVSLHRIQSPARVRTAMSSKNKYQSPKKMIQRRILLSDQCRVCESAKSDDGATRCELKCLTCEMTVHKSCYQADEEPLPEKWRCRPCQYFENHINEQLPLHVSRILSFLTRFRRDGLKLQDIDISIRSLANALQSPKDYVLVYEVHSRLLQNIGVVLTKCVNWVDGLVRFLKTATYPTALSFSSHFTSSTNPQDWLTTYQDRLSVDDRLELLKLLCEIQFDENEALMEQIGEADSAQDSEALRDTPIGVDALNRIYYVFEDSIAAVDGTVWVCRCNLKDGSKWETVSDDVESLESFLQSLSYSTKTVDLRLWRVLTSGVYKRALRRQKKQEQQQQRRMRLPRVLGNPGIDISSIIDTGSRRSMRTRRAVSYHQVDYDGESEEEQEEESEASEDEDDDEKNDSPSKKRRLGVEVPSRCSERIKSFN